MKSIAIILSVYILALTAIPCTDVHAKDSNSDSIEILVQDKDHGHSSDVDLCSPFCFCHCCQTLSFPSFFISSFVNVAETTLDIIFKEPALSSPFASVWQPPKL